MRGGRMVSGMPSGSRPAMWLSTAPGSTGLSASSAFACVAWTMAVTSWHASEMPRATRSRLSSEEIARSTTRER